MSWKICLGKHRCYSMHVIIGQLRARERTFDCTVNEHLFEVLVFSVVYGFAKYKSHCTFALKTLPLLLQLYFSIYLYSFFPILQGQIN